MITLPTVHMNGTGKQDLFEANVSAAEAVLTAMEILAKAAPHERDYYVQGDGAFKAARQEYAARMDKLRSVRDELMCIAEHLL